LIKIFILKILGFDNVAKLLKNLIDDILVKGGVNGNEIVSIVSNIILNVEIKIVYKLY
jgi:hypothetical protein